MRLLQYMFVFHYRFGDTNEIAGAASFLASDDSSYMTGETLVIAGGIPVRMWSEFRMFFFLAFWFAVDESFHVSKFFFLTNTSIYCRNSACSFISSFFWPVLFINISFQHGWILHSIIKTLSINQQAEQKSSATWRPLFHAGFFVSSSPPAHRPHPAPPWSAPQTRPHTLGDN